MIYLEYQDIPTMNLNSTLELTSFLTVFVSFLFVLFLLTVRTKNKIGNIFLSLYFIVRAINLSAYFYSDYLDLPITLELLRMDIGSFLQFPFLYLFVLSIVYSNFKLKRKHLLHLLPFVFITLLQIPSFYFTSFIQQNEFADTYLHNPIGTISIISAHFQALFYIFLIFIELKRYKTVVLQNYSIANSFNYKWLFQMNTFISIIFLIAIFKNLRKYIDIPLLSFDFFKLLVAIALLIFTCWLVIKALHAPKLFKGVDVNLQVISETKKSNTTDNNTKELLEKLTAFMNENEPYTNPELTITELANGLNVEERKLSGLINRHMNLNFHRYINSYRIEKAKLLFQNPEYQKLTVLEILYQVGFNSKSSFNTYFKKETSYTPTEYRKKYI